MHQDIIIKSTDDGMDKNKIRERIKSSDAQRDVAWLMAEIDRLKAELGAVNNDQSVIRHDLHLISEIMQRYVQLSPQGRRRMLTIYQQLDKENDDDGPDTMD